jgi:hypothetical protein
MFTANYDDSTFSYWISETDAEGVGEQKIQIRSVGLDKNLQLVEQVSRLVLIALSMEGGVDHALALLRAERDPSAGVANTPGEERNDRLR